MRGILDQYEAPGFAEADRRRQARHPDQPIEGTIGQPVRPEPPDVPAPDQKRLESAAKLGIEAWRLLHGGYL
jgi:hypothetical protein